MSRLGRIKLFNFVLFQAGWFACVLGAAHGFPLLGPVAVCVALGLHFGWASRPRAEAKLLLACGLAGLLFDAALLATGWVDFPAGWWLPGLAPYWMMCMWLLFGTTLNLSLSWLHGRPSLAVLLGAVGGPLAYLAGERLGGITLVHSAEALIALAAGWGVVTPLLAALASRWNGFALRGVPGYIRKDFSSEGASSHV